MYIVLVAAYCVAHAKPCRPPICYVSLCEGLRAAGGSLSYIVHVDCCGLSTIVIKKIIIILHQGRIQKVVLGGAYINLYFTINMVAK